MELENNRGAEMCKIYKKSVDLKDPDLYIYLKIAEHAYIYFNKIQGLKGLPVDVSGNVLSLLSGGIDSPVASYLMMKRGCRVNLIHFHVFADNESVLNTKMWNVFNL